MTILTSVCSSPHRHCDCYFDSVKKQSYKKHWHLQNKEEKKHYVDCIIAVWYKIHVTIIHYYTLIVSLMRTPVFMLQYVATSVMIVVHVYVQYVYNSNCKTQHKKFKNGYD